MWRQAIALEQAGARTNVGPFAILDGGHDNERPLETLRAVRRHQLHGLAGVAGLREGVAGDLLSLKGPGDLRDGTTCITFLSPGGLGEQHTDRVEVVIGTKRVLTACLCFCL